MYYMQLTKVERTQREEKLDRLDKAIVEYNDARADFEDFRDAIASRIEDFIADKSDKWQEGEKGEAFRAWCDAWGEECGDELSERGVEYPEEPEGI